jgi:signal peptidase I
MTETKPPQKPIEMIKSALPLVYLIAGLFALRWSVVEPYVVPTGSMEPTLKTGDRLYALKCAYNFRVPIPFVETILFRTAEVKRGDVILFKAPLSPDVTYVKRCVGLPGDRIEFRNGVLYVNGEEVKKTPLEDRSIMYDIDDQEEKTLYVENLSNVQHYVILDNLRPNKRDMEEILVPPDHVFAVGDNRDNSFDGRAWGFVPMDSLKGKALFLWYSSKDFRPRTERIGTLIQ